MIIDSEQELNGLKRIGRIVGLALKEMKKNLRPGITTAELDGFFADSAATVLVPPGTSSQQKLCRCAKSALYMGDYLRSSNIPS